jgi:hypothetical protein
MKWPQHGSHTASPIILHMITLNHFSHPIQFNLLGVTCVKHSVMQISGFRHNVDEICTHVGYYAASSGKPLPTLCNILMQICFSIVQFNTKDFDCGNQHKKETV